MKAHKVSKDSNLTLEEKIEAISNYDLEDVRYALTKYKETPDNFEKEVKIALYNKLFEFGMTSI
jgi:hypothetical protein